MSATLTAAAVSDAELATVITAGASRLGVDIDTAQTARLVAYLHLIDRWNGTYNLTAVRDLRAMATQHIVDSLAAVPSLRRLLAEHAGRRILDAGSGAGLPGVVIAIVDDSTDVVCVDSVGKKAAFLTQVAVTLGLRNLSAMHARVEALRPPPAYDIITSRAFASLPDFVSSTRHLLAPGGRWVAMKGKMPHPEVTAARELGTRFEVQSLEVPGLEAERCLLIGRPIHESEH